MTNISDTEKVSGIYKIINNTNNKYYIGSSNNIHKRWKYHQQSLNKQSHPSKHLQRSWNKYGASNFNLIIIQQNISDENLLVEEQKYLDVAKHEKELCYNSSFIAGRIEMNDTNRQKISISQTGKKLSEETKEKLRNITLKQFENGMPDSTKKKLSDMNKGKIMSRGKGWHHTNEAKQKISHELKGKYVGPLASMFGKKHTEEWKSHMKILRSIRPFRLNDTIHKFQNSITNEIFEGNQYSFYTKYNLLHQRSNIGNMIKGKRKSVAGWKVIS